MIQIGLTHTPPTSSALTVLRRAKAPKCEIHIYTRPLPPVWPPQTPVLLYSSDSNIQMSLHPASLISSAEHSTELLQLLDLRVNRGLTGMYTSLYQIHSSDTDLTLIEQIVQSTVEVVNYALDIPPSSSRGRPATRANKYAEFTEFATGVIERAEATVSDILVALVYIQRARPYLSVQTEDWALHRVFLGVLITASKYTNDSTLKNIHWAMVSGTFGKRDIGRIEREFIEVVDWDLAVTEADLLLVRESLLHLIPSQSTTPVSVLAEAVEVSPSSPSTTDSDSSESSHWSDDESDSDSHSTPPSSPAPSTPSHAVFSPARSNSITKPISSIMDAIQHPFWTAPHHPLSVHVVA